MRVTIDGRPVRFPLAGVGQYVANLATALSELEGHELQTTLLLFDGFVRANRDARRLAASLTSVRVSSQRLVPRRLFTAWLRYAAASMPGHMVGGGFDVWHSTYFEAYPRIAKHQRLVSTIHDVIFLTHPHLFATRNLAASRYALARQARDSHQIIVVSDYTRAQLLSHSPILADRVTVVPLAVTVPSLTERRVAASLSRLGIDRPYVLYVGNLEPRKDLPTLLRSWSQAEARHDHSLILAGASAYLSADTHTAIATSVADVRWLGYVSETDKSALLSKAVAFVYPSVYEGFGLPILEALAHGLPVIACNTSSIPEVSGPGAILVPPSSPDEMRLAIDRLLGDASLRRTLSLRGRQHAAQYSWRRVALETLSVYTTAAGM